MQLQSYFAGRRNRFDLPLYLVGSPYRKRIWSRLGLVPHGELVSYSDMALEVGGVGGSVGAACAVNPLLILVPCHRVVAANGLLTGYAGGLWRKKWLIEHEGAHLVRPH